ncbi:hypothetical protein [Nitrosomonas sp. Nm33]|uniref:hypothetical protein n=1 Tax=Nitrosomonas sp. Nm33 TaxID=133724 RepID=UPI00089C089C|nr:hypothetical protein [Nitrosomonas sp. Nm33]SDY72960.1 hypothetical protein SAMN05421755_10437 [Nitrosomonas sp. Nm33]
MTELKDFIEIGVEKARTQIELAKRIGILDVNLRMAKAGKRGLPIDVCILLADYIKVDRLEVIAASNLVTEKDERRRRIFESCFKKSNSVAASILMASIVTLVLLIAPVKPANATHFSSVKNSLYVICNSIERKGSEKM